MEHQQPVQVPQNILSLLKGHLPNQDPLFISGICSLLFYQYPHSDFTKSFQNSSCDLTLNSLSKFLNSGTSARSPQPVKEEGN